MNRTVLTCFSALIVSLAMVHGTAAVAGPLEDGVSAYNRGKFSDALKLLSPLADSGEADAQYTLALMYSKGEGVTKDPVRAYMYYDLLAQGGDKDAASDRDALGSKMTPEQLAEAKKLGADKKPGTAPAQ